MNMFSKITVTLCFFSGLACFHQETLAKTITITNHTNQAALPVYMGFNGQSYGCYSQQYFSSICQFNTGNQYICQLTVVKDKSVVVNFNQSCQVSIAFTAEKQPWGACPTSLAEFTLNGNIGGKIQDTIDVSLVNGINKKINISSTVAGSLIDMTPAVSPYNKILGVYPPGCDGCAVSLNPPTWPNCPGKQPQTNCQAGTQFNPQPGCQISRVPINNADSYVVSFIEASSVIGKTKK